MKELICDTNIWYGLGNDTISKPDNVKLIATWINIIEIGYSHPKIKPKLNEDECKSAAKAILKFSDNIIEMDTFCYATKRIAPGLDINVIPIRWVLEEIASVGLPNSETYFEYQKYYDLFLNSKSNYSESINKEKEKIREKELKNSISKKEFKDSDELQIQEHVCGLLKDIDGFLKAKYNKYIGFVDQTDFDQTCEKLKNEFECFVYTRQMFMKKLNLTRSMKMQPNDYFDLQNLLYVDKDKLFWTKENRWKTALKEANVEKYLFEK